MNPSESQLQFEHFIASCGHSVATLTPPDATRHMLAFYRQVRAANCPLDADGDMILFQWGAYDFGEGETYRYEIVRQFIPSDENDEGAMSQLSLTVHYPVTDTLRPIIGNRWFASPEQADELERFIATHEATKAVSSLTALRTTLDWSLV